MVKVFSKRALPAWGMHATASLRADLEPPRYAPWGLLAAIDLHGCDRDLLEDPELIRRFVTTLVDAIEMRAHGPALLERFGDGELEGWSAMQFIETSSITRARRRVERPLLRRRLLVPALRRRPRGGRGGRALRRHADAARAEAMIEIAPVFGILAAVVGIVDTVPYVRLRTGQPGVRNIPQVWF